jgi:hypothetical protein
MDQKPSLSAQQSGQRAQAGRATSLWTAPRLESTADQCHPRRLSQPIKAKKRRSRRSATFSSILSATRTVGNNLCRWIRSYTLIQTRVESRGHGEPSPIPRRAVIVLAAPSYPEIRWTSVPATAATTRRGSACTNTNCRPRELSARHGAIASLFRIQSPACDANQFGVAHRRSEAVGTEV